MFVNKPFQAELTNAFGMMYFAVVFVITIFTAPSVCSAACVSGSFEFNDYCYLFHNITSTIKGQGRNEAQISCHRLGGDLLDIYDKSELDFINDKFKDPSIQKQHYWIGLNDIDNEGAYIWTNGSALTVANWRRSAGEPNNWNNNEDCVEATWDGKWNDNDCDNLMSFICKIQKDAVVPPTPTLPPFPNATEKPQTCEAGWIPFGTSCYGIIRGIPKTWNDARADCLRRFGDLLVIESKEEQIFFTNELANTDSEFWMGLSDSHFEKKFFWVDETPLNDSLSNWRVGEPSVTYNNEDCVEIYGKWLPGRWNDNHCDSLRDYICEKVSGEHRCPKDWISYGKYCYEVNSHPNQKTTWLKAQKNCHAFNEPWRDNIDVAKAELVSIMSADEGNFLHKQFLSAGIQYSYFWTGLNSINATDTSHYVWTDAQQLTYTNWKGRKGSFRCVKANVNSAGQWQDASCTTELSYYVCKVKRGQDRCYDPLGLQSFKIPDSAFTASGQLSVTTPPYAARLYLKASNSLDGAWCEKNDSKKTPWLKIDFGRPEKLTYMGLQGKSNSAAFVTVFYLQYSMDGVSWNIYGDIPPARYFKFKSYLSWRTNNEKVMNLPLPSPLMARYVTMYPLEWNEALCMRVEFYGCQIDVNSQACGLGWIEDKNSRNCYRISSEQTTWDVANSICETSNGKLVSISSKDESDFIKGQLNSLKSIKHAYWTGMNALDAVGIYRWSDGTPTPIVNWYTGDPPPDIAKDRCVSIRTADGTWMKESCMVYRPYICKRKYVNAYIPKVAFNSNWKSSSDFYWPLDVVLANGMTGGSVMGQYLGDTMLPSFFPINRSNVQSPVFSFNGKNNYLKTQPIDDECALQPNPENCPHGISVSLLFKYKQPTSSEKKYLVDTMGDSSTTIGYSIYIRLDKVYAYVRGPRSNYLKGEYFNTLVWNHFVFTWSRQNGLRVYVNGWGSVVSHGMNNNDVLKDKATDSIFVAKSVTADSYTLVQMSSLAVFKRSIDFNEVKSIYNSEFAACRRGEIEFGSYCYEFNTTEVSWSSASTSCEKNNGYLMSIQNPIEQALVTYMLSQSGLVNGLWIGLNSKQTNHVYNWTDSSPFTFSFWNYLEPNNHNGRREDCVQAKVNGYWNDDMCYLKKAFACKYERTPIPLGGNTDKKLFTAQFWHYQTRTFGCTLTYLIQIKSVYYGSTIGNCFLPQKQAMDIVRKKCSGATCRNIRATDYFFNKTNPCEGLSIRSFNKKLTITYSCGSDPKAPVTFGCPKNYVAYKDKLTCYRLYMRKLNVTEASKQCQADGGELASVSSRDEQVFLTTLMGQMYEKSEIWLGMKYDPVNQTYVWLNNNPVNYTHWYDKQPDPRQGEYIKITLRQGARDFLFWQAAKPEEQLPFFCRKIKVNKNETVPKPTPAVNGTCLTNWTEIGNDCYYFNAKLLTFNDAQDFCQRMGEGGSLASIHSIEENRMIYNIFTKAGFYFSWLGLSNQAINNGYRWLDGSPLSFINWYTGHPYTGSRHLCAGMRSNGMWMDVPCYAKYASICQVRKGQINPPTTAPPVTPTQDPSACLDGWKLHNGNCYYFSNDSNVLDWHNARVACQKFGSKLTSIAENSENNFIHGEIKKKYSKQATIYIGLNDISEEDGWQWTDGTIASYFLFRTNQPDNWHGMEDCVAIGYDGNWNDVACNIVKPYICKKANNTVPTSLVPPINPTAPPDVGYCEEGWKLYGAKCYYFQYGASNRKSFEDAENFCNQWNGSNLVSIHSAYENAFILSQLYDAKETIFIGLSDRQTQRRFLWNDQSTVDYTNWYIAQPSRYGIEDCVEMMPFYRQHGRWNDINCNKENGFVCQRKSFSNPPPTQKPGGTTTTVSPSQRCPSGYKKYQMSCYHVVKTEMSWDNAWKECKKTDGSDLASLHSPFEQAYLMSYFTEIASMVWIGYHKHKGEQKLHWSDGSSVDYIYWQVGQNWRAGVLEERCVAQVYSSNGTRKDDGKWKQIDCNQKMSFACRYNLKVIDTETKFKGNCSDGWTKINNKCYQYVKSYYNKVSWPEARTRCITEGGDLATITDKDLQDKLQYMIRDGWASVWIGLNDRSTEHTFVWSSGRSLGTNDYSNWEYNEPSDTVGSQNCVGMAPTTGQWDDASCYQRKNFICEHALECREALGMESKEIPNSRINATSFLNVSLPGYARINFKHDSEDAAWCTKITNGNQSITVDLGDYMAITRISTQGLSPGGYVMSYQLEYTVDGYNWIQYTETDGNGIESTLIPGNKDSSSVVGRGVSLNALQLRITPKRFKGQMICMRLEFYGCKAVCSKPLGMGNYLIHNEALSASSSLVGFSVEQARPLPNTKPWCAQIRGSQEWYQIDLTNIHKITRVMVTGPGTLSYTLSFSDDDKTWREYTKSNSLVQVFPVEPSTHELGKAQTARYVKVLPLAYKNKICLKVELFGCTIECDVALGMESNKIPNRLVYSSSSLPENPSRMGRLNQGTYGENAWCAGSNDISQYLEIDFGREARITHIAIQGSDGDVARYVTKYQVQWSKDGDFWHHIDRVFTGNRDGRGVTRIPLPQSILAQFVRINPIKFVNHICMRVEIYGCPIEFAPVSTNSPTLSKKLFYVNLRLPDVNYHDKLADANSLAFRELADKVVYAIDETYFGGDSFKDGFHDVIVTKFKPGSVIVSFTMVTIVLSESIDALLPLKEAVKRGKLGDLNVDKTSLTISSEPPTTHQKIEAKGGMSSGAKIGLIVFFLLLIAFIVLAAIVYYSRKKDKGFKLQFAHKSFDNPVHLDHDEMNVQFMNDEQ